MLVEDCCTPVVNGHIRMNANFLFDEGAQCSFISVQLATKLQVRPTTTTQVALWSRITNLSNSRCCHYPSRDSIGQSQF